MSLTLMIDKKAKRFVLDIILWLSLLGFNSALSLRLFGSDITIIENMTDINLSKTVDQ